MENWQAYCDYYGISAKDWQSGCDDEDCKEYPPEISWEEFCLFNGKELDSEVDL